MNTKYIFLGHEMQNAIEIQYTMDLQILFPPNVCIPLEIEKQGSANYNEHVTIITGKRNTQINLGVKKKW